MISRLCQRAWLLALIGASICTFSPRFLHADSDSAGRGRERSEHQESRREGKEDRDHEEKGECGNQHHRDGEEVSSQERGRKQRNMHPELQVASPYNRVE